MRFENGERVDSGSEYDGLTNLKMSIKLPISTIKSGVTSNNFENISLIFMVLEFKRKGYLSLSIVQYQAYLQK